MPNAGWDKAYHCPPASEIWPRGGVLQHGTTEDYWSAVEAFELYDSKKQGGTCFELTKLNVRLFGQASVLQDASRSAN